MFIIKGDCCENQEKEDKKSAENSNSFLRFFVFLFNFASKARLRRRGADRERPILAGQLRNAAIFPPTRLKFF